jgi:hypothetical protein
MRTRRAGPLPHVLIAGDVAELDSVRALLCLLPATAYGQLYLEVEEGHDLPELPARPARVGVTAIVRRAGDATGDRLSVAVDAWGEEWMGDVPDGTRELSVWVGASVRVAARELEGLLERL